MKYLCLLLTILSVASINAYAEYEVVVTAAPYTPPPTVYISQPGTTVFNYDYKAAALVQARATCAAFAAKQKGLCDDKTKDIFDANIQSCNNLGTAGTAGIAGGGVLGAVGAAIAILGGPGGWAVLFVVGGGAIAGGGVYAQQEGNYACRDQASLNEKSNAKACANYQAKINAEICAKIY